MGFDRYAAKMQARNSMRLSRPSPLAVTLVYFLLTTLLSQVIHLFLFNPTETIAQYLQWGYPLDEIMEYVTEEYARELLILEGVNLVLGLYTGVMAFGYASYALRLARDEAPAMSHIFDGFLKLGKALLVYILTGLLLAAWMLVPVAAAVVVAALSFYTGSDAFGMLYLFLTVAGTAVGVMASYRYRLANYFLLDDPGCGPVQALVRSRKAMRGWKMDLFVLDLSFLGWHILAVLTMNILNIWLMPYQAAATANFYDCVTAIQNKENEGGELPELQ